jgi:ABC-2 type transport system ATP-binding protein
MLTCRGLRKEFGPRVAVDGVSFSVTDGECYGLLGPNGAGKTTTISMVCGLLDPDGGDVTIAGAPGGSRQAKAATGYVPQDLALYPDLSGRENLRFFGQLYGLTGRRLEQRIDDTLSLVGLADRGKDRVGTYSGGMKRRANIAAGLLHEPRLLILDEPTVGVDPQSRNAILDTVAGLGITVLYTTHYMEEATRLCQRIGIIDEGRLIAEGTSESLIADHGGQDRIRLTFASAPSNALAQACSQLAGVQQVQPVDGGLELMTDHGPQMLPAVVRTVADHGVELTGAEVLAPNLEAVFLALTGKELRD